MFKGHPKGLFVAFFANMGERFGFYTMVSVFVLFLQAKYGLSSGRAGTIYGVFMFFVYFFPLVGGLMADRWLGYGRTISVGLVVMFLGYVLITIPGTIGTGFPLVLAALAVIALGTGLFKGNLQALVGNLYDDPRYAAKRDRAFNIFYMGINIGAMFAPSAAEWVSNLILRGAGFTYDARIPALANGFLKGTLADASELLKAAQGQVASVTPDGLRAFATSYLNALSRSYNLAFGAACLTLIVSMLVFWGFRRLYKSADVTERQKVKAAGAMGRPVELTPEQTRARLTALGLVFLVVIFFWMAFQESAVTMTYFARDYTVSHVSRATNLWFDLFGLLSLLLAAVGLLFVLRKASTGLARILGAGALAVFGALAFVRFNGYAAINAITPQKFQHFNPFFIVSLTPLVIALFGWLNARGKEPSAPRKIGIGMLITAAAFAILMIGSRGLPSPKDLGGLVAPEGSLVSVYWLITTYFTLTVAELFLSPMGISFVSKVAPPKYKGLMQGGWFAATAIGNYLVGVMAGLWSRVPLWAVWAILVGCCLASATFMFSIMKKLERASSGADVAEAPAVAPDAA